MEIEMDLISGGPEPTLDGSVAEGGQGESHAGGEERGSGVQATGVERKAEKEERDGTKTGTGAERRKSSGRQLLVIHNTAWKSWIPALASALLLVSLGIFFLFVQFEAWTVHSIVSLVLVANGLVLLTKTRKETCTFDQAKGKLTIRRTTWRGRKVMRHWLMQIKEVRVEEYKDPQGGTDYELYLFLRSGQRVKIFSGHLIGVGSKRKLKARDEIVEFLEDFSSKYTTRSRASHSGLKGYMKKQLSGALRPPAPRVRRRGRSSSLNKSTATSAQGQVAGVGLAVPSSPKREKGKRNRSTSYNPGASPPVSRATNTGE